MMKRVKIASNFDLVYHSYLGKLEEKFKTLMKQARGGYWGWSSGKTFSAQGPAKPQHEAPGSSQISSTRANLGKHLSVPVFLPGDREDNHAELPRSLPARGTGGPGSRKERTHQGNISRDSSAFAGEASQAPACQAQRLLNWYPKEKPREKESAAALEMPVLIKTLTL